MDRAHEDPVRMQVESEVQNDDEAPETDCSAQSANHRASSGGGEAGVTNLGVSNCPPQLGAEAMHGSKSAVHNLETSI